MQIFRGHSNDFIGRFGCIKQMIHGVFLVLGRCGRCVRCGR